MKRLKDERTELEETFAGQLRQRGLPAPEQQYRFAATKRKFALDFAWPERMIALEVEGGTYSGGRHVTPLGFERDAEKYNLAAEMGWRVFRATTKTVEDETAADMMQRILRKEEDELAVGGADRGDRFAGARRFARGAGLLGG